VNKIALIVRNFPEKANEILASMVEFPADVKPTRPGVYVRESTIRIGESWMSRWDGEKWMCLCVSVLDTKCETVPSSHQSLPWYGLNKEIV